MKFSQRIQNIKPSMTLAITAKAKAMSAQGDNVIGFGAGEPDFGTPENIKQAAIDAIHNNDTYYTPVGGTDKLKDAIIEKFKRDNGLAYSREQIIVSCGAKHSFYNLAMVLWDKGDEVIVPAPYWVSYPEMVTLSDATPVIVETEQSNDFKITPEQLQAAVTPNTRAVIINSPSNPTGSAYTRAELEALAEVALRNKLMVVSDEIYEKIVFDGFEHVSIASFSEEMKKNTVVINGASKCFAMTGWRIGYLAAEADIVKAVNKIQGQSTSNPTSIAQAACVEALTGAKTETAIASMVDAFTQRRNVLMDRYAAIDGVKCYKPVGSFYSFPDFSAYYGRTHKGKTLNGSLDIADFLLEEAKVAVVPGIAFGADANQRLSFATSLQNIEEGLDRIQKALATLG
ncbi:MULTISPECIES: pyridoxal phosphate-dependent aminotransferase [unclassified Nitrospina]|uniref:pyridoxal phosphate-dependent aminotransferase n=1 Tax=unclassified Nitrospina TaxID=2638683 RepID=UPI003F9A3378